MANGAVADDAGTVVEAEDTGTATDAGAIPDTDGCTAMRWSGCDDGTSVADGEVVDDEASAGDPGAVGVAEADAATGAGAIPDSVGCTALRWIGCDEGACVADGAIVDGADIAGEAGVADAEDTGAVAGSIPDSVECTVLRWIGCDDGASVADEAVVGDDGSVVDDAGAIGVAEADAATGVGAIPDTVGCTAVRWSGCDGASVAGEAVVANDEASAGEPGAIGVAEADAATGVGVIPDAVGCTAVRWSGCDDGAPVAGEAVADDAEASTGDPGANGVAEADAATGAGSIPDTVGCTAERWSGCDGASVAGEAVVANDEASAGDPDIGAAEADAATGVGAIPDTVGCTAVRWSGCDGASGAGEAVVANDEASAGEPGAIGVAEADAATGVGVIPDAVGCTAVRWSGCDDGAPVAGEAVADDAEASTGDPGTVGVADAATGAGAIPDSVNCAAVRWIGCDGASVADGTDVCEDRAVVDDADAATDAGSIPDAVGCAAMR